MWKGRLFHSVCSTYLRWVSLHKRTYIRTYLHSQLAARLCTRLLVRPTRSATPTSLRCSNSKQLASTMFTARIPVPDAAQRVRRAAGAYSSSPWVSGFCQSRPHQPPFRVWCKTATLWQAASAACMRRHLVAACTHPCGGQPCTPTPQPTRPLPVTPTADRCAAQRVRLWGPRGLTTRTSLDLRVR